MPPLPRTLRRRKRPKCSSALISPPQTEQRISLKGGQPVISSKAPQCGQCSRTPPLASASMMASLRSSSGTSPRTRSLDVKRWRSVSAASSAFLLAGSGWGAPDSLIERLWRSRPHAGKERRDYRTQAERLAERWCWLTGMNAIPDYTGSPAYQCLLRLL